MDDDVRIRLKGSYGLGHIVRRWVVIKGCYLLGNGMEAVEGKGIGDGLGPTDWKNNMLSTD